MNIIGVSCGHNASACLLRNGRVDRAISEEKFNNEKNWAGFPSEATRWCAAGALQDGESIDYVAVVGRGLWLPDSNPVGRLPGLKRVLKKKVLPGLSRGWGAELARRGLMASHALGARRNRARLEEFLAPYVPSERIRFVDHHLCHAASAYYGMVPSDGEPTLIFTLDGYGDFTCATVSVGENARITRIASTPMQHSLGNVYGKTTLFMGMRENEHEYKVMGLAPYAKHYYRQTYERVFRELIHLSQDGLSFGSVIDTQYTFEYLAKRAVGERFDNIAGALQFLTEDLITRWVRNAILRTGIRRICTAGGVFMNVKANMRVAGLDEVDQAFFMPSCGDETTPVGAAYATFVELGEGRPEAFGDIYWGMSYSSEDVEVFIRERALQEHYLVERCDDVEARSAELLASGEVIARVKGRCEFGARALGNRSILANPRDMRSFYTVNDQIKARDFWMPFAPSLMEEYAHQYIHNPKALDAPFMILGFPATELGVDHLRAAMHQGDHTVRPQIVRRDANPDYHRLIEAFHRITGIGGVLNTSLNLHGYPLVGTLEQALFTFERCGLRNMTLGDYLIRKR